MPAKKPDTKVTRISASDSSGAKKGAKTVAKKSPFKKPALKNKPKAAAATEKQPSKNPLAAIGRYFKGAWVELRQVHWPTRRATWGLTGAVLAFSAFFVIFISLLDAGFKLLFELILK